MALNRGNPGNKGGGAHPKTFRIRCQTLAERAAVVKRLEAALDSKKGPDFWRALDYCTEHGYGKAPQTVQASGDITVHVKREDG